MEDLQGSQCISSTTGRRGCLSEMDDFLLLCPYVRVGLPEICSAVLSHLLRGLVSEPDPFLTAHTIKITQVWFEFSLVI